MTIRQPRTLAVFAAIALLLATATPAQSEPHSSSAKPTIVLVHGAWADASSWNGVIARLHNDGYTVRAIPNHLRTLSGDAASVRDFLTTISGPIILVGHSYGGAVITNAAGGLPNVKALVYINAFAPDTGETVTELAGPDSALSVDPTTIFDLVPATLPPTPQTDVYLKRTTVFASFATGLDAADKAIVFATQRPATLAALNEPTGTPGWKTIPSWNLIGTTDKIIPVEVQRSMAKRAGSTVAEYDGGHVGLMSDPRTVTRFIEKAARG